MPDALVLTCPKCQLGNVFQQPYAYHAGHGDQGFLYSDSGHLTLVWSSFDPAWEALVGQQHPWALGPDYQAVVEEALLPAPDGGRWRFRNPPRCRDCGEPIERSIGEGGISYVVYPNSVILDEGPTERRFTQVLRA